MKLKNQIKTSKWGLSLLIMLLPFCIIANSFILSTSNVTEPLNSNVFITNANPDKPVLKVNTENPILNTKVNDVPWFNDFVSDYTLIATEEIELKYHNIVTSGGVGVIERDGKIKVENMSQIFGFAKAQIVEVDNSSSVGAITLTVPFIDGIPTFIYNTITNDDSPDIVVEENQNMILDGSVYGKIEVKDGGTLTFSASDIFLKEFKTEKNTTINFNNCGNVYLVKGMELGEYTNFNLDRNNVIVYADYKVKVEKGSNVFSKIYVRDNELEVKGYTNHPTFMNGIFFAKKIKGEKYVTWNKRLTTLPCESNIPEQPCQECKGGLLELTLQYTGANAADIMVLNNDDDVLYSGNHATGEEFTFVGLGDNNKMSNSIYMYVNGIEVTDIHTSCSQPIGPGVSFGDFTVVSGISKYNGSLCPVEPGEEDCECKGGLLELTLQYTGANAADIMVLNDEDDVLYSANHATGEEFTFVGLGDNNKMSKSIYLYVNGVEVTDIHTSCSQPIGPGVSFGDFTVVSGISKYNGPLCPIEPGEEDCECDGGIVELTLQYNGPSAAIMIINKDDEVLYSGTHSYGQEFTFIGLGDANKMTNNIYVYVNGVEMHDLHVSCSQPIGPGLIVGDFTVVSGFSRDNGALCAVEPDCECDGGIVQFTMLYLGTTPNANVMILNKDDDLLYSGTHSYGSAFAFVGLGDENRMTNTIHLYINGVEVNEIHTSCSQPIEGGMSFGDLYILSGISRNNGLLCGSQLGNSRTANTTRLQTNLWPNPSNNDFNIKVHSESKEAEVNVQVFDINGKLLLNDQMNYNQEFTFGKSLSQGLYFVKISDGKEVKTLKVLKQ